MVDKCHPRGLGITHPDVRLLPGGRPRLYGKVLRVLEKVEPGRAGTVIGAKVIVCPAQSLRRDAAQTPRVSHDPAADSLDAGGAKQLEPGGEQSICRFCALRLGTGGRISSADDVKVSLENSVLDGAIIPETRLETEILAKRGQRQTGRDELHVGRRDKLDALVVAGEGITVHSHGEHTHRRRSERRAGHYGIDRLLREGLRNTGSRAPCSKQKRD